ncbi:hypothetical protein BDF22DRAFT_735819 [Syncephalis plumigaleata]|nr:hypothetical protein BDF22DRAFT_735819 [Syncephalis plumigaleata]
MHEITFKVRHTNAVIRRFSMPVDELAWPDLKTKIENLFEVRGGIRGVLYADNDGDCIFIGSNEELTEIINYTKAAVAPVTIRLETVTGYVSLPYDSWLMEGGENDDGTKSQTGSVTTIRTIVPGEGGQQQQEEETATTPINNAEHAAESLINNANETSLHGHPVMMPTVSSVPPVVNNRHGDEAAATTQEMPPPPPPPRTTTTPTGRAASSNADLPPLGSQIASLARQFVHTLQSNPELNENARQVLNRTVSTVEQSFTHVVSCLQTEFTHIYNTAAAHTGWGSNNANHATSSASTSYVPSNYPVEAAPVPPPHISPNSLWTNEPSSEEEAARIARQVEELKEMGFYDEALCRRVLAQHVDISSAVQAILEATNSNAH